MTWLMRSRDTKGRAASWISTRLGRGLEPHVEDNLRRRGESALLDVVRRLEDGMRRWGMEVPHISEVTVQKAVGATAKSAD